MVDKERFFYQVSMENILLSKSKFILSQVIFVAGYQGDFFDLRQTRTLFKNFLQFLNWQRPYEMQPPFLPRH